MSSVKDDVNSLMAMATCNELPAWLHVFVISEMGNMEFTKIGQKKNVYYRNNFIHFNNQ